LHFRRGKEFGISTDGFTVNMSAGRDRKRRMVSADVEFHRSKSQQPGGELIIGSGRFVGLGTLEVTQADGKTRLLLSKNVVISTGMRARLDPIPGLAEAQPAPDPARKPGPSI
jgi:pyruvate/2-oxoglutarate dehydrogenase complex dihydrolipoamide dehydrogenase (E3) component